MQARSSSNPHAPQSAFRDAGRAIAGAVALKVSAGRYIRLHFSDPAAHRCTAGMRLQRALAQALLCPLLCDAAGGPVRRHGARITGPGALPRKAGAGGWRPVWLERGSGHRAAASVGAGGARGRADGAAEDGAGELFTFRIFNGQRQVVRRGRAPNKPQCGPGPPVSPAAESAPACNFCPDTLKAAEACSAHMCGGSQRALGPRARSECACHGGLYKRDGGAQRVLEGPRARGGGAAALDGAARRGRAHAHAGRAARQRRGRTVRRRVEPGRHPGICCPPRARPRLPCVSARLLASCRATYIPLVTDVRLCCHHSVLLVASCVPPQSAAACQSDGLAGWRSPRTGCRC